MAATIPAKLKSADISRFATRAAQCEKVKPVVSYWCNYWIVNQILAKGLHNSDSECLKYTTDLMDKLEQFKSANADNDTVVDDAAGQAYVEQFGLETFQRADNAVRANKASLFASDPTPQTADTFQAAATFLELCQIWGQIDPEIAAKVKFAKYHALRIAKALKAGEDPNLSNPSMEEDAKMEDGPPLDPNDPEVQALHNPGPEQDAGQQRPRQPSVEDVPDDFDSVQRRLAQQSSLDESLHPSRSSSVPPPRPQESDHATAASSTGLPSPPTYPAGMMDLGPNHPHRPSRIVHGLVPDLPAAPSDFPSPASSNQDIPSTNIGTFSDRMHTLSTFQSFPAPSSHPPTDVHGQRSTPSPTGTERNHSNLGPPTTAPPTSIQPTKPIHGISSYPNPTPNQGVDEDAIATAQKHARWAVSALNFDDVNTAIKELRNALEILGAK
ncbi:hypothetical protein FQN51_007723 [Onygenales sp. PD_10]|nr:hypothetical protein FQN51_007723 [Onygenales sp. PD_10]